VSTGVAAAVKAELGQVLTELEADLRQMEAHYSPERVRDARVRIDLGRAIRSRIVEAIELAEDREPYSPEHVHGPDCDDCVATSRGAVMAFAVEASLRGREVPDLVEDLRFWSVAQLDASDDYVAAGKLQAAAHTRYQEATSWTSLIANELRSRRGGRPVQPEQ
jgi:hypothetical protein